MPAPRCVEEDDRVLLDLVHLVIVVVGHDLEDGALLLLGDGKGLHVGPDLAGAEVLDKAVEIGNKT